jgi:hypothetical protein
VTVRPPVLAGLPTCSLSWRAARLTSTTTTRGGGLWILDRTYSAFEVDLAKFNRGRLQALLYGSVTLTLQLIGDIVSLFMSRETLQVT